MTTVNLDCSCGSPSHGPDFNCPVHGLAQYKQYQVPEFVVHSHAGTGSDENFDPVNRPKHYNSHPSGVEAIEVGRHLGAAWFNAFKYVFRADLKNGRQDIEKALWYAGDGVESGTPIWMAPAHRTTPREDLRKIIAHETGWRRAFFIDILHGDPRDAEIVLRKILEEWVDA